MYLVLTPHCMTEILAKECKSGKSTVLALGTVRIMEAKRSLPGSRASVFTPIENVWRRLMNMLMSWENKVGKIRENYQNSL